MRLKNIILAIKSNTIKDKKNEIIKVIKSAIIAKKMAIFWKIIQNHKKY